MVPMPVGLVAKERDQGPGERGTKDPRACEARSEMV